MPQRSNTHQYVMFRVWQALRNTVWQRKTESSNQTHAPPISSDFTFSSTNPPVPWPGFSPICVEKADTVRKLWTTYRAEQGFLKAPCRMQKHPKPCSGSHHEGRQEPKSSCEPFTSHYVSVLPASQNPTASSFTDRSRKVRRNADARYKIISGTIFPLPPHYMDVQNPLLRLAGQSTVPSIMAAPTQPQRECVVLSLIHI